MKLPFAGALNFFECVYCIVECVTIESRYCYRLAKEPHFLLHSPSQEDQSYYGCIDTNTHGVSLMTGGRSMLAMVPMAVKTISSASPVDLSYFTRRHVCSPPSNTTCTPFSTVASCGKSQLPCASSFLYLFLTEYSLVRCRGSFFTLSPARLFTVRPMVF